MKRILPVLAILILFLSCTKESKPLYHWDFNFSQDKKTAEVNTCAVGALVAGQEEANPKFSDIEIKKYMMLEKKKPKK